MRYLLYFSILSCSALILLNTSFFSVDTISQEALEKINLKEEPDLDRFYQRTFPDGQYDRKAHFEVMQKMKEEASSRNSGGFWVSQGPQNIGARANAVAVHPEDPNIIFLGFSRGGLWRTKDGGNQWIPVFDDQSYLAISHIVFDPANPDRVLVGTGDRNISGNPFIGNGIYVSENCGDSWSNLGLTQPGIISDIYISPQNSDIIYASSMGIPFERNADRGLYKSEDGGENWSQILYINDSTGVNDIVVHPFDDNIIYACGWNRIRNNKESKVSGPDAKIHRSYDGGDTWEILENGLPDGEHVKVHLDISHQDPNRLYAAYVTVGGLPGCDTGGFDLSGVYTSEDGGDQWSPVSVSGIPCNIAGGFGWYFTRIKVNPFNDQDISILGVRMFRTLNGGLDWFYAEDGSIHADKHDLAFAHGNLYLATDGGAYRAPIEDTQEWEDIENIPTTQFYRIGYNKWKPQYYYGGTQDNGTIRGNEDEINEWVRYFGGDGFSVAFHEEDPDIYFVEYQNGNILMSTDGEFGDYDIISDELEGSKAWDMFYTLGKDDPNTIYTGTDRLYKGRINGNDVDWEQIGPRLVDTIDPSSAYRHQVSTFDQSTFESGIFYLGTNDGLLWRKENNSTEWININHQIPRQYVTDIKVSKQNPSRAFVCISGYKYNDFEPHIYMTNDYGDSWEPIHSDLPNLAINHIHTIVWNDIEYVFIANDGGVYYSENLGESWDRLGENMPIVSAYDLDYHVENNELILGTFARGIFSYDLTQIGIGELINTSDIKNSTLSVYPTVAKDFINYTHNFQNQTNLKIIHSSGQILRTISVNNQEGQLDITGLPAGQYYLVIFDGFNKATTTFLKS